MLRKIERGTAIDEATKGSLNYTMQNIRSAFYRQHPDTEDDYLYIREMFADHVIVSGSKLADDEFYYVPYTAVGNEYTFAARAEWEVVELTYQPQTIVERLRQSKGAKVEETIQTTAVRFNEAIDGQPRTIQIDVAQAGVINGNGRRYREAILREAVAEARFHLHESLSQGRAILLGESEHPTSKRQSARLTETIVKWTDITYDADGWVRATGQMIENANGRDAIITMDAGVLPGASLRGFGEHTTVTESGRQIQEIEWLRFAGIDLVMTPSFAEAGVTHFESLDDGEEDMAKQSDTVDEAELRAKITQEIKEKNELNESRELAKAAADKQRLAELSAEKDAKLRSDLGIDESEDLETAVATRAAKLAQLEEADAVRSVNAFVEKEVAGIKAYPPRFRATLTEAIKADGPKTVDEAKASLAKQRGVFDPLVADMKLRQKGRGEHILGDIFESETGYPEFAKVSYEITESLIANGKATRRNLHAKDVLIPSEKFTVQMIKRYDAMYMPQLLAESKTYNEAETTTDLNLPYSVMRSIMEEAYPDLIAANVFDFGVIESSETRVYYESQFAGETGYETAVTGSNNVNAAVVDTWYALGAGLNRIQFDGISMQPSGGGTAYTYGSDYVIDFILGRYMVLSTGTMAAATNYDFDYTYNAVRNGEGNEIERAKATLAYEVLVAAADRLALQVTNEAVIFSRTQVGWDAVSSSISLLIKELRLLIDRNLLTTGLSQALTVANNSGGTWNSATDSLQLLVEYMINAEVKITNRYYTADSFVVSKTTGSKLILWDGFTAAGTRPGFALDNAAGMIGYINQIPVFTSTEMPDSYILCNNKQLVMHRVYQPMRLKGPFPVYGANRKIIASDEYYVEEFNGDISPIPGKGSVVKVI